ncbi:MAG: glycosyltransferase [Verrucomicrobiota bacterium]|nr:glycosyltransferase [Verrucomicrobiota bacterium]
MTTSPLRILCVVNLGWDARLGAARVWIALSEEWGAAGHIVEKFCITDAFLTPSRSRAHFAVRQALFPRYAAKFIRENASRFDVIDGLIGTVTDSPEQLGFRGLLVARSVGLPLAYDRVSEESRRRWPDQPRGRLVGRVVYRWTKERINRNSQRSLRHCDLLNLPNETERALVEETPARGKPIVVQPYGLDDAARSALREAAEPVASRLAAKTICFVGMWILRKGSRDWSAIMRGILRAEPAARFKFLGTMTSRAAVFRDLTPAQRAVVTCCETYAPGDLPKLLSDCAIGVFPSYVEGFGIAVLEQLAAGIPTVAYDAPGPREILEPLREELLVPVGDATAVAARVIKILRDAPAYELLRKKCFARAAHFTWREIASATIQSYRPHLRRRPIVCTQPFGLRSTGGGARIMRAILRDAPAPLQLICTAPDRPPRQKEIAEVHLPLRPHFGRLERTRFAGPAWATAPLFTTRFHRRLEKFIRAIDARAIHAIAHGGTDFFHAYEIARATGRPFLLHVHDDFVYTARAPRTAGEAHAIMGAAWRNADARFVIGRALGEEYARRYGAADYTIITDGISSLAAPAAPRVPGRLRIYFMGLFHLEYEANLAALLAAMEKLRREAPALEITLRCGTLRPGLLARYRDFVRVLPFGSEADVARDLEAADLLYLPLPFEDEHAPFVRYSLSTKVVTYLGSGIPILYHGPREAAVCELLRENNAALSWETLEVDTLADALRKFIGDENTGRAVAGNALRLARREFWLPDIRARFWNTMASVINPPAQP